MINKLLNWWKTLISIRSISIGKMTIGRLKNLDVTTAFDATNWAELSNMMKYTLCFSGKIYSYGIFICYTQKDIDDLTEPIMEEDLDLDATMTPSSPQYLPKLGVGRSADQLRMDLQKQLMHPQIEKEAK